MEDSVAILRLRFIHEYRDRHGKMRRYFRRPGMRAVPLPGEVGSQEFMQAYESAIAGQPIERQSRFGNGTLGALVTDFYKSGEFRNLKPSSQRVYRVVLGTLVKAHGHRKAHDLPTHKARKIIQEIGETRPGMANLTRKILRVVMSHAIAIGWRRDNPITAGRSGVPTYKLGKIHTWTDDELTAFEGRWPLGTRERLAYALLLYTSQRGGDVVRMRRSDIKDGFIKLTQQKTGAELAIPLHAALLRALKAGPAKGIFLIGDADGRPIGRAALTALMRRAVQAAGLPERCKAHGLRKAAMRRLAEHGGTEKELAAISGHKSLSEVKRYTEMADQAQLATTGMNKIPDNRG
jgi:integrase